MTSYSNPQFTRALGIQATMDNSPRFGFSKDFADLFNEDKRDDYIVGTSIFALIIACFFFCWLLFLCFCKCMGQRVGFLSGSNFHQNKRSTTIGRLVFGISGMGFIAFALTLVLLGLPGLESKSSEVSDGALLGRDIFTDANLATAALLASTDRFLSRREEVLEVLEGVFLSSPNPSLGNASLVGADYRTDFSELAKSLVDELEKMDLSFHDDISGLSETLEKGEETCEDAASSLDQVDLKKAQLTLGIPLTVLSSIMILLMVASSMGFTARSGCIQCVTGWLLQPLFLCVVLLLLVVTCVAAISGIINSDFCHGGEDQTPDSTLLEVMLERGMEKTGPAYRTSAYVVKGCDAVRSGITCPLDFVDELDEAMEAASQKMLRFISKIDEIGTEFLSEQFDYDMSKVTATLNQFQRPSIAALDNAKKLVGTLACERLFDIYSKVVDDAVCDYTGLVWTFYSMLAMTTFGCLVLTFRSAMYPVAASESDSQSGILEQSKRIEDTEDEPEKLASESHVAEDTEDELPFEDEPDDASEFHNEENKPRSFHVNLAEVEYEALEWC